MIDDEDFDLWDINPNKLDIEWRRQIKEFRKCSRDLSDAKRDLRQAEADLELVDAELCVEINRDPAAFDLPKGTVELIKAAIIANDRHTKATSKVIELKHRVDVMQTDVNTMEQKKYGLQDTVKLFGLDYLAAPVASGAKKDVFDEAEKRSTRSKVKIKRREVV